MSKVKNLTGNSRAANLPIEERLEAKNNAHRQMSGHFMSQALELAYSAMGSFHLFIDDAHLFKARDSIFNYLMRDHTDATSVDIVDVDPSPQYPSGLKAVMLTPGKRSYHIEHILGNERLTLALKNNASGYTKSDIPKVVDTMMNYLEEVYSRIDKIIDHLDSE